MTTTLKLDNDTLDADYHALRQRTACGIELDRVRFALMHGNGNTILVVDTVRSGLSENDINGELARALCRSFTAIRVDGIAFLSTASRPVRMTYFEGDGMHSQMCGNALRCSTRYCAERNHISQEEDFIATDDGLKWVSAADGRIRVALGHGREFRRVEEDRWFVFSGLPHLVLDVDDLDAVDVKTRGAALRFDHELCLRLNHPEGLHVDFAHRHGDRIAIRTYEPGTEDETLACGTGVGGTAYVAHRAWDMPFPVTVTTLGGDMTVEENGHGLVISGTTGYLFDALDR
ncbi:diaminopimelate epimerase [Amycolatopsis sp. CA-230715]|uniref:diaminopimelate epimerase n=1 Tax=Amycolatopsis sp. CA-230715 TaxID=2745196 RepID=UPI001C00D80F|nr:diaminopimelate epimerase [Amycolatopsis sp. CA-230715]QWF83976.1 Diaminopimelate epimerase [Amycolatopsis sp. CA-230715]